MKLTLSDAIESSKKVVMLKRFGREHWSAGDRFRAYFPLAFFPEEDDKGEIIHTADGNVKGTFSVPPLFYARYNIDAKQLDDCKIYSYVAELDSNLDIVRNPVLDQIAHIAKKIIPIQYAEEVTAMMKRDDLTEAKKEIMKDQIGEKYGRKLAKDGESYYFDKNPVISYARKVTEVECVLQTMADDKNIMEGKIQHTYMNLSKSLSSQLVEAITIFNKNMLPKLPKKERLEGRYFIELEIRMGTESDRKQASLNKSISIVKTEFISDLYPEYYTTKLLPELMTLETDSSKLERKVYSTQKADINKLLNGLSMYFSKQTEILDKADDKDLLEALHKGTFAISNMNIKINNENLDAYIAKHSNEVEEKEESVTEGEKRAEDKVNELEEAVHGLRISEEGDEDYEL